MSETDVDLAASKKAKIGRFWWKVLDAISTVTGLCVIAIAHWLLDKLLAFTLAGPFKRYHHWIEVMTFAVFYAVYFFLLVEILEMFWPERLKIKAASK